MENKTKSMNLHISSNAAPAAALTAAETAGAFEIQNGVSSIKCL